MRNIHVRFLRLFKNVVIGRGLLADLRRHAVEALGAVFSARQGHVGDSASNAAADAAPEGYTWKCVIIYIWRQTWHWMTS